MNSFPVKPVVPQLNRALARRLGLIAAWPFVGRGGTILTDVMGLQNGTLNTGVTWQTGVFGPQANFNGASNGRITLGAGVPANPPWSITVWFRPVPTGSDYASLLSHDTNPGFYYRSTLRKVSAYVGANGTDHLTIGTAKENAYNLFGFSDNGSASRLFLNGAVDSSYSSLPMGTMTDMGSDTAQECFLGQIADIRVYNRALSDTQMAQIFIDPWAAYRPAQVRSWALSRLRGLLMARRRALLV